ncbi:MAG: hypothetical protein U0998_00295 [Moraxellaceae bacterium]|nr:hypothetical protein [Moraxellaceae bacterium]MDZ4385641.1 hypothetical protein [Moraxellaceae bacterium]
MTSIHAQDSDPVRHLLARWRDDPGATYQSWFLWEERLKNFRSIRRGLQAVISEIEAGSFGTQYRGSSLETVVHSIAEQRQIFKGADHAFLWIGSPSCVFLISTRARIINEPSAAS